MPDPAEPLIGSAPIWHRVPTPIAVCDRELTRLIECNPAWVQMMHALGETAPGDLAPHIDALHRLVDPEDLTDLIAAATALRGEDTVTVTVSAQPFAPRSTGSDSSTWWKASIALAQPDLEDGPVIVTLYEVTEEIRLQHHLTEVARAAGEANRAKTEFLSRVSHELRTPLQGVLGFVQLIQLRPDDPDTPRYLELAAQAGEQMVQLIAELQEVTRIEEGHIDLSVGAVNLSAVIADVLMMFETEISERGIRVATEGLDAPTVLASDRRRLHQILANLVSNAIKYNVEGGELRVTIRRDGQHITVDVADTGRGLSEEQLSRMFTPFDRLGAESSEVAGTGIGLVVARQLTEALGARLSVTSALGEGTCFTLHMECPVTHSTQRPISMLCVDDNQALRTVIEATFAHWEGLRLRTAGTAKAALALAAVERPDLILLDVHLPDRNGCDLIPEFRAMADPARRLHVAVFSADSSPETMSAVARSGADQFFPKPLNLRELIGYVAAAVTESDPPGP